MNQGCKGCKICEKLRRSVAKAENFWDKNGNYVKFVRSTDRNMRMSAQLLDFIQAQSSPLFRPRLISIQSPALKPKMKSKAIFLKIKLYIASQRWMCLSEKKSVVSNVKKVEHYFNILGFFAAFSQYLNFILETEHHRLVSQSTSNDISEEIFWWNS